MARPVAAAVRPSARPTIIQLRRSIKISSAGQQHAVRMQITPQSLSTGAWDAPPRPSRARIYAPALAALFLFSLGFASQHLGDNGAAALAAGYPELCY